MAKTRAEEERIEAENDRLAVKTAARNQKAVMQALDEQNKKLHDFSMQINAVTAQLTQIHQEFTAFRKERVEELIAKLGHGPTIIQE